MGLFDGFRTEKFPTQHPEYKTAAVVDVLEAGFILAFVILATCLYLLLLGSREKTPWCTFFQVTTSLFIGTVLMVCNFGQDWEVGHIISKTPYKAGQGHEITAKIGLKLGLRSLNVTLERIHNENHEEVNNPLDSEIINYNERFWWTWDQGRIGFGPFAGHLQQDFRRAQLQGLPLPILWVADYFTIDGEGLRFGRYYRTAGWYTHIAMWSAFPCWLLANIFFLSVIRYGAFFITVTGLLQVLACILWAVIRNPTPLVIPFEDATLTLKFGTNYWFTLVIGIFCIIIGMVIFFLDLRYPDQIASFFGIDPLADYEEYHLTATELQKAQHKGDYQKLDSSMEMSEQPSSSSVQPIPPPQTQIVLKRRTTIRNAQRSLFRTTAITQGYNSDQPIYHNTVDVTTRRRLPPIPPTLHE